MLNNLRNKLDKVNKEIENILIAIMSGIVIYKQFKLSENLFYKDTINFYNIRKFYDDIHTFIEHKQFEDIMFFISHNKIILLKYIDPINNINTEYSKLADKVVNEFEIYKISRNLNINEQSINHNYVRNLNELEKNSGVDFSLCSIDKYDKRLTPNQIKKTIYLNIKNIDQIEEDTYEKISDKIEYINNLFVYQNEVKSGKYNELIEFNDDIFINEIIKRSS